MYYWDENKDRNDLMKSGKLQEKKMNEVKITQINSI